MRHCQFHECLCAVQRVVVQGQGRGARALAATRGVRTTSRGVLRHRRVHCGDCAQCSRRGQPHFIVRIAAFPADGRRS
jgi:hypothetical protein